MPNTKKTPRAKRKVALTQAPSKTYQLQKGAILCWMRPGQGRGAIPTFGRIERGKGVGGTLVT